MTTAQRSPSFVLILTDTQATNVIGAYRDTSLRTPCIDELIDSSVTFDRAYASSPICTPARAGLFTGLHSHRAGAWTNGLALAGDVRHMGERFRALGYDTAYIGKWHLDGLDYFGTGSSPPGWSAEHWYDGRQYLESLTLDERVLQRSGLDSVEALREAGVTAEFTWGHQVSDRAIAFLRERSDHDPPFLLVISYDEPHHPFTCPYEFVEPFLEYQYPLGPAAFDDLKDKPRFQQDWARAPFEILSQGSSIDSTDPLPDSLRDYILNAHRRRTQVPGHAVDPLYFGCNSFIDSEIGRVLSELDHRAGDDAYVVYTSDHGEMLGSHGLWEKGPAVYEEIAHVPLAIRCPASKRGRIREQVSDVVSHVDVLPTLLDLAGAEIPEMLYGRSLAPHLRNDDDVDGRVDPSDRVFVEFHRFELELDQIGGFYPMRAIITERFKLSVNLFDSDELYDLEDDPAELTNRIADPNYFEIRDRLHDDLLAWMHERNDPFRSALWEDRPWRRQTARLGWLAAWPGVKRARTDPGEPPPLAYDTGLPETPG